MITKGYKLFLDKLFIKINDLGLDVVGLQMDHLGYQAKSEETYDKLKPQFLEVGKIIYENLVGGRRVSIYKLFIPLKYKNYSIYALELYTPKKGQICQNGFEHVEFVLKESFASFMKRYQKFSWDISAINQDIFSQIKLRINDNLQIKFHQKPVLEIVKENNGAR